MRSAGNFHPEWGYLAPAQSFMRTARIALVATAIGATAGAVVVVSLLDRPGSDDDNSSIAAHALVTSAPVIASPPSSVAEAPITKPPTAVAQSLQPPKAEPVALSTSSPAAKTPAVVARAPLPPQVKVIAPSPQLSAPAGGPAAGSIASASQTGAPAPTVHGSATASADDTSPAMVDTEPARVQPEGAAVPEETSAKKVTIKKHHPVNYAAARRSQASKRWRNNRGFAPLLRLFSFRLGSSSTN